MGLGDRSAWALIRAQSGETIELHYGTLHNGIQVIRVTVLFVSKWKDLGPSPEGQEDAPSPHTYSGSWGYLLLGSPPRHLAL